MKIKVILLRSTAMIGQGVLMECIQNSQVESVLLINRKSAGITHDKLKEIIHPDFYNFDSMVDELKGYDACFFCLGISSAGKTKEAYHKVTFDLTLGFAKTLVKVNPDVVFCYVSGAGTDSSEKGRMMWARVKGKTENALLGLPFRAVFMFRPGYIQPMDGTRSKTRLYNILYAVLKPFYFLIKPFRGFATNNILMGKAMVNVVVRGSDKKILESSDINNLALLD